MIPKDYALAHFPHKNQTITLQIPGQTKKWHCQFRVRSDGGRCNLFGCDFAGDNHLLEGDLCLFQPTTRANGRTFKVAVHLLRKASNDHTSRNLVIGSNRGLANSKLASTMRVKEEPDVGMVFLRKYFHQSIHIFLFVYVKNLLRRSNLIFGTWI